MSVFSRWICLAVVLVWPASAQAQSLIQSNPVENSASVASFTNTFLGAVTPGNNLIAVIRLGTQSITAITVSDSVNGTWSLAKLVNDSTNGRYLGIYYKENTAAGTPVVTVAWSTANDGSVKGLDIYEYSGLLTSSSLDQTNGATPASTSTPSSGNVTTTAANELLIGALTFSTSSTVTVSGESSGFAQRDNDTIGTGAPAHNHLHVADQNVSSTGTYAYQPTVSSALVGSVVLATFKASGVTVPKQLLLLGCCDVGPHE